MLLLSTGFGRVGGRPTLPPNSGRRSKKPSAEMLMPLSAGRRLRLQTAESEGTGDRVWTRWGHHGDSVAFFAPKFHSPGGRDL